MSANINMSSSTAISSTIAPPIVPIGQLATAFKSVLDLFSHFNIPEDATMGFIQNLNRLDAARLRLLLWAHSVGLPAERTIRRLHAPDVQMRLITALGDLEALLSGNAELVIAYGVTVASPGSSAPRVSTMGDVSFRAFISDYEANHADEAQAHRAFTQINPATFYTIVHPADFDKFLCEVDRCVRAIHALLPPPVPDDDTVRYFSDDVERIDSLGTIQMLSVSTRSFYLSKITILLQSRASQIIRALSVAPVSGSPPRVTPEEIASLEHLVFGWFLED